MNISQSKERRVGTLKIRIWNVKVDSSKGEEGGIPYQNDRSSRRTF